MPRPAHARLAALLVAVAAMLVPALTPGSATSASAGTAADSLSINSGGSSVRSHGGRLWLSDRAFVGGRKMVAGKRIAGTRNDGLYRQARVGVRAYRVPVAASGTYRVRLLFADSGSAQARRRQFSVRAEGQVVVRNLNVVKAVGPRRALRIDRFVVSNGQRLDITFRAQRGRTIVSGIQVARVLPNSNLSAQLTESLSSATGPAARPSAASIASAPVQQSPSPPKPGRKLLIEHGWDVSTAAEIAADRTRIDALPLDGVSVRPEVNPLSSSRTSAAFARTDLAAMPTMSNVSHNFLLFRMVDDARAGAPQAYDFYDDALWSTIGANAADYAAAARASGEFDGIMVDTEYYGEGSNPWNYGSSASPWSYSGADGATPGHSPADAQAQVQLRGKQVMDAIRSQWPDAKVMFFRAAWLSEPLSFTPTRMNGNNVAWANELNGPFVVGFVESALGTPAAVIDGTELYTQRSLRDFENVYDWARTGLSRAGGRVVPSGGVSAAAYADHITVAQVVYDRDVLADYAPLPAATFGALTKWALETSDEYTWLYTENHDWRGTGWPFASVPQTFVDAVGAARLAAAG